MYFKALSLRQLEDVDMVKIEVRAGNIVVVKITLLAKRSIDDAKRAVDELCAFVESVGGDIARLGDERLVITPSSVKIWKEKENLE
ncbi:MAG: cell division protein SepF [Candidatus Bathyarchaeota archaeon]